MKSKLNLECLSERITPSVGVDNPGVTGYSIPTPPSNPTPPPSGVLPTREEAIGKGDKFIEQINVKSNVAAELATLLKANEADQAKMKAIMNDPTKTQAERNLAKITYELLVGEHDDLVDLLNETIAEYRKLEIEYLMYRTLVNDVLRKNLDFPKYQGLPNGYEQYLPDPRLVS